MFRQIYSTSLFKRAIDGLAERRWWRIVLVHEAGHAIAWASLFGRYCDLTAECAFDENEVPTLTKKASYGTIAAGEGEGGIDLNDLRQAPAEGVQVLAAGMVAEKMVFDIDSEGFAKDRMFVRQLALGMRILPSQVSGQVSMAPVNDEALEEVEGLYPKTRSLVEAHSRALMSISDAAFDQMRQRKLFGTHFEQAVLLTAKEVRELFESQPPPAG